MLGPWKDKFWSKIPLNINVLPRWIQLWQKLFNGSSLFCIVNCNRGRWWRWFSKLRNGASSLVVDPPGRTFHSRNLKVFKLLPFGSSLICWKDGRTFIVRQISGEIAKAVTEEGRESRNIISLKWNLQFSRKFNFSWSSTISGTGEQVYDRNFCWQFQKLFWGPFIVSLRSVLGVRHYVIRVHVS